MLQLVSLTMSKTNGYNVILPKVVPRDWRRWSGRLPNSGMAEALETEHRDEVLRMRKVLDAWAISMPWVLPEPAVFLIAFSPCQWYSESDVD